MTVRELLDEHDEIPPLVSWGIKTWLPDEILDAAITCRVFEDERKVSIAFNGEEVLSIGFDDIENAGAHDPCPSDSLGVCTSMEHAATILPT